MSTAKESYCNTSSDLLFVEPSLEQYGQQRNVLTNNWVESGTPNLYFLYGTGYVEQLFLNSAEMNPVTVQPSVSQEYRYIVSEDRLEFFITGSSVANLNSQIFEGGRDWESLKTDAVKRASSFIDSYIPFPIYQQVGANAQDTTARNYPEIIVRSASHLAVESIIRPLDSEKANEIRDVVYNESETGWLDKISQGKISLQQNDEALKQKGYLRIVNRDSLSTGSILDVSGIPTTSYDKIKIIITGAGSKTLGTATTGVTFSSFVSDADNLGTDITAENEEINCKYQNVGRGMSVRFSEGTYSLGDEWSLEISGRLDRTVLPIKNAKMKRVSYR